MVVPTYPEGGSHALQVRAITTMRLYDGREAHLRAPEHL